MFLVEQEVQNNKKAEAFINFMADLRPTLSRSQGERLVNSMLFTTYFFLQPNVYWNPQNDVQNPAKHISQINELGIVWFRVDVLSHCATLLY